MGIPFERLGWLFVRYGHRVYPGWARPALEGWLQPLAPGSRVLDLGGGTGVLTAWALESRPDLEFTVVDVAPGMMAHAPKPAGRLVARAEELPLASGSVAAVMIGEALHHFKDSRRALAEVARVLNPAGRLWIYDFDPTRGVGRWVYWGERLAGEPASFYRPARLARELEKLGFVSEYRCRKGQYVLTASRQV